MLPFYNNKRIVYITFPNFGGWWNSVIALFSMSCITEFAKMGDTGEPIGVPNICLKYFPRNAKYDDCIQISNPSQTSCIDQFVRSWKSLHSANIFLAISTAKVVGICVNNDTTSKDTKISSWIQRNHLNYAHEIPCCQPVVLKYWQSF